jgi:hypothetical protein
MDSEKQLVSANSFAHGREMSPVVARAAGRNNGLLFLSDIVSKQQFLVDTGAEVSVLPATGFDTRTRKEGPPLSAANGSSIKTYGTRTLSLHLATNTYMYQWDFVIPDVSRPLLGTALQFPAG